MGDDNGRGIWLPAVLFVAFIFGWMIGVGFNNIGWKKEAVEYGYAEYDSQTGDWQWLPKPIEVTGVGIVGDGKIEWNDGTVTEAPR